MNLLESLRQRFALADDLVSLALVGVVSGLLTGLVIAAFLSSVESLQLLFVPGRDAENYEALAWWWRLLLPLAGGLIIGLGFEAVGTMRVGVVHVMERLANHEGHLPLRNAIVQFAGAALSVIAGHSVGREGPSIHLGAATSSLLGQWLRLPNNSIRTLVACGTAAGIGASFNTPIAGVIFAMEVVMMDYTISSFLPVILAAVSATSVTRAIFGADPVFAQVPQWNLASLWELPYITLMGVMLGLLAGAFIYCLDRVESHRPASSEWVNMGIAGLVTGMCALAAPQIMGIGYDTVGNEFYGAIGLGTLALIVVLKLVATVACIGLGLPGGLIGPTLFMGATAGAVMGLIGVNLVPEYSATSGLYAMLGMGAMMGATLQAPLAALMAMMELTANPNIIMPGMLAIVTATLTTKVVCKQESAFIVRMRSLGLDYRNDSIAVLLSRVGVAAVMDRHFSVAPRHLSVTQARSLMKGPSTWLLIADGENIAYHVPGDAVRQIVEALDEAADDESIDLRKIPGCAIAGSFVPVQVTLREALRRMDESGIDTLCITRGATGTRGGVCGVITREAIMSRVR